MWWYILSLLYYIMILLRCSIVILLYIHIITSLYYMILLCDYHHNIILEYYIMIWLWGYIILLLYHTRSLYSYILIVHDSKLYSYILIFPCCCILTFVNDAWSMFGWLWVMFGRCLVDVWSTLGRLLSSACRVCCWLADIIGSVLAISEVSSIILNAVLDNCLDFCKTNAKHIS